MDAWPDLIRAAVCAARAASDYLASQDATVVAGAEEIVRARMGPLMASLPAPGGVFRLSGEWDPETGTYYPPVGVGIAPLCEGAYTLVDLLDRGIRHDCGGYIKLGRDADGRRVLLKGYLHMR